MNQVPLQKWPDVGHSPSIEVPKEFQKQLWTDLTDKTQWTKL